MMTQALGAVGVFLLLTAFVLNLANRMSERSSGYLLLNFVGAGMAAVYAFLTGALPFEVLESVWAAAALVRLITTMKKAPG